MKTVKFSVSYEKLISRLPALFPYVEIDEWGVTNIVKATNSAQGDYGRIVADLRIDQGFDYTCSNGEEIHITAGRRSYRTLIDAYYKAIKDKKWERDGSGFFVNPFLAFIEKGIGLKYVHLSEGDSGEEKCGVKLKTHYPLAPDYIYLADARRMYDEVIRMKKQIDFWDKHIKNCKEDKPQYVALKNRFDAMNGNELLSVLEGLIIEAEEVAEEYLKKHNEGCPSLKFNVNLNNTIKDLGMVTPMIEEWVAGKRYYNGDVVYYVDENGYGLTWECQIKDKDVKTDENGRKYIEGYFDEESELIYFEDGSVSPDQYWFAQTLNWVKANHRFVCTKCGRIYEGEKPNSCDTCGNTEFNKEQYVPDSALPENGSIVVQGTCDSHLTSFRRYENYMSSEEQVEYPDNFKDWLWFYRVGTIVNREEINDNYGNMVCLENPAARNSNIIVLTGEIGAGDDYGKKLAVWGDVLADITATNNENGVGVITFTYWMGAHLTAESDGFSVDDDGNYKYYFKNFALDEKLECGVKYTESYIYYESAESDSLWYLVASGKFDEYIRGKFDKGSVEVQNEDDFKLKEKFEFITSDNIEQFTIKIGNYFKKVPFIKTSYETKVDISSVDFEKTALIRYDYYNGVQFHPTVNTDVSIERGLTQAFEKYIKFSEIKTFDDFVNYSNGGFFSISEENMDLGK